MRRGRERPGKARMSERTWELELSWNRTEGELRQVGGKPELQAVAYGESGAEEVVGTYDEKSGRPNKIKSGERAPSNTPERRQGIGFYVSQMKMTNSGIAVC